MIKKKYRLYEYFYVLFLGIILVQLFFIPSIRLGVITSILMLFLFVISITKKELLHNSIINKIVLLYIVYNTVSVFWFSLSGYPLSAFAAEWSNTILPVFFFYFSYSENENRFQFYSVTLYALIFSFILGFYLLITDAPLYDAFMRTTEGVGTDIFNFQSLFGLTATGVFGVVGFLISTSIVFTSNGKRGKTASIICALAAIMTFRRAALVALAISIVASHFLGYFKFGFLKKRYLVLEALLLCVTISFVNQKYGYFLEGLITRDLTISDAFDSRSMTWNSAFETENILIGKGLGAFGHKISEFSSVLITDGNYFKILAESGFFGFFLFISIIIISLIKGAKNLKENYLDLGIVFSFCLIAIGSNIFTFPSVAPIFWYSIGRISRYKCQSTLQGKLLDNSDIPKIQSLNTEVSCQLWTPISQATSVIK